jgi:pilus assembly protein CpaB
MFGDRRYRFLLYVALLVASLATFGVWRIISGMQDSSRVVTQEMVVAADDIAEGVALTSSLLRVVQLPVAAVPAGAFAAAELLVGRVARVTIFKGEAIVPGRLAPEGTGAGLVVKIPPGKRAMAVRIDDVAGLAGLVHPNSRVDVMLTTNAPGTQSQVSKLFMSNMRVLAIGSQVTRGADGMAMNAPTATLEVTPEEAERLALATREGRIQLVLRGYGDPDSTKTSGAVSGDLLEDFRAAVAPAPTLPARPVAAPARPKAPVSTTAPVAPALPDTVVVQVFRGDKVDQVKFRQGRDSVRRDSSSSAP